MRAEIYPDGCSVEMGCGAKREGGLRWLSSLRSSLLCGVTAFALTFYSFLLLLLGQGANALFSLLLKAESPRIVLLFGLGSLAAALAADTFAILSLVFGCRGARSARTFVFTTAISIVSLVGGLALLAGNIVLLVI